MKYIFPILFLITALPIMVTAGTGQQAAQVRNLFVEWQPEDSTIILGQFSNNRLKRIPTLQCSLNKLSQQDVETWLGEDSGSVLLFFHCMWGQQPNFHKKKYLASFDKIFAQSNSNIQTEISVIWHAGGINYLHNYQDAAMQGAALGNLVSWISAHYQGNANVLCHSMGNRFFEGVLRTKSSRMKPAFRNIILFSADVDNGDEQSDLTNCIDAAENVYVYIHAKDKFLQASSVLQHKPRLGRSGPASDTLYAKLHVIDMTNQAPGVLNHTHIDNVWVQQQISENLAATAQVTNSN